MKRPTKNRKGQLSLEAAMVMIFFMLMIQALWFSGPAQQSVEKSTDFNGVVLAEKTLDNIASAVKEVGFSGYGEKSEFIVHMPYNTVYAKYGNSGALGPHVNISVLLLSSVAKSSLPISNYTVTNDGYPAWTASGPGIATPFFYINLTKKLDYPLEEFPLCDHDSMKDSNRTRGEGTVLRDVGGNPIKLCCESGFNLRLYATKLYLNETSVNLYARRYYELPGAWNT